MIYIEPNFLEQPILDQITNKFESSKGKDVFELNNMGRWGAGLEAGSYAPVFILRLDEYKDYFYNKYSQYNPIFSDYNDITCYLHIWPPGSQINFHNDEAQGSTRLSSTIYINPVWNWNWGGFFIYEDIELGKGWIFPHYNLMIWFQAPVWHSTSMVTLAAPFPRLSIQLFFHKK